MKIYAFIFARGGSKGLPGKNIKELCGMPLIAWSITIAKSIESISEVFVSTDNEDIAKVARHYNATVINRPCKLATDDSPEWLSWKHAIEWVELHRGIFDIFISLPATSPLRSKKDIEECIKALNDKTDIVVTILESNRNPWFNMVKKTKEGSLTILNETMKRITRRQDAPKAYDLTTVAYVSRPSFILCANNMWDGKIRGVEVNKENAVDIDSLDDFKYAEFLLSDRKYRS